MLTVLEIIKRTTDFLAGKGVENPRLNAELLIGHGLGLKRMQLYLQFERPLTEQELERIRPLVRRRGAREPLQYIVGEAEFGGLTLKVDRRALIPRPETEYLVELVTARWPTPPARILDLGTGTGALALSLAKAFPDAVVVAVDSSEGAIALATENVRIQNLEARVSLVISDWFEGVPAEATFDLIVSNPPYLTASETAEAAPEVKDFEPIAALTGKGDDGSGDLLTLIDAAPRYLAPNGMLALETGIAQHSLLGAACERAGLTAIESLQDLTKRDRYVIARKSG